jgi:hypothetical protein
MSFLIPLAALFAQAVATPPAAAPRALAVYDVAPHFGRAKETAAPTTDELPAAPRRALVLTALYVGRASSDLVWLDGDPAAATPATRLLASLVEEEARTFDPTVRCIARQSSVLVESAATTQERVRQLFDAASSASRERNVVVAIRFLLPGAKAVEALKRAGIACDGADGGARVQTTSLTTKEIDALVGEDGEPMAAPRVMAGSGESFTIREEKNVALVTGWEVVPVEELGTVLEPKFATFDEGLHVEGTALVVPRTKEHGGERLALDLEIAGLAIGRPIPQEKRVVDGKEVVVQQPTVKQSSLHALFTLAPDQRVVVAGLARPTFTRDEPPRPILLEVVAHTVAATAPPDAPAKEH